MQNIDQHRQLAVVRQIFARCVAGRAIFVVALPLVQNIDRYPQVATALHFAVVYGNL